MTAGKKTPIDQGLIARVVSGVKYIVGGNTAWMPSGQPLAPVATPAPVGRQFDFPVAVNTQTQPRSTENIKFADLRGLADNYDLLRLAIETRKDQISKLGWIIRSKDDKTKPDNRCKEITDFFALPDKEHDWETWLRMVVEDQLVIDAATIYARKTIGGGIYAFEPVDGATIKRVITSDGRTPIAPEPAYQQVLKGVTAVNYTNQELIYAPRNLRTNKIYGYSPVEQVIITVNIAIRRQISQLQYYTEGNVPEAIAGLPANWSPDQVKQFQQHWDALNEGNTAQRRHMKFIAGDVKLQFTKDPMLKDEFDEWLARVICYAFSLPPSAFVKQMNRATAGSAQETALEEGLMPLMQWIKNLINRLIVQFWGYTDLEFTWEDAKDIDPAIQANINQIYLNTGVKTINEVRAEIGLEPMDDEELAAAKPQPAALPAPDNKEQENTPPKKEALLKKKAQKQPVLKNAALIAHTEKKLAGAITKLFKTKKKAIIADIIKAYEEITKVSDDDYTDRVINSADYSDWGSFAPIVTASLKQISTNSGKLAIEHFSLENSDGDIVNLVNEQAVIFAENRGAELVGKKYLKNGELVDNPNAKWAINEATRDMLRTDVTTAINEGWSTKDLANALSENYAFSDARAETISRTEVARSHIEGQMIAYREAGVEKKQWILGDEACDECQANADEGVIAFDDAFPSGDDAPPAHPNCLCDLIAIIANPDGTYDDDNNEEE